MLSRTQLRTLRAEPLRGAPNRLRRAIALAKTTQERIEDATGVDQSTVSKLCNGQIAPMLVTAQKLAIYFNCQTDDLFPKESVAA